MLDASKLSAEEAAERIAVEQYEVHKFYAEKLVTFGDPHPMFGHGIFGVDISAVMSSQSIRPLTLPPKPRQKFTVCDLAGKYAVALLKIEIQYRPHLIQAPDVAVANTGALVVKHVKANAGSYHATEEQIAATAFTAMMEFVSSHKPSRALPAPRTETVDLGRTLKALRNEAGWTVRELAEAVQLTSRTVFRHEANQAKIRASHLRSYEKAFGDILKRHISLKSHSKVTTTPRSPR